MSEVPTTMALPWWHTQEEESLRTKCLNAISTAAVKLDMDPLTAAERTLSRALDDTAFDTE